MGVMVGDRLIEELVLLLMDTIGTLLSMMS